jgi:hypothetical protein
MLIARHGERGQFAIQAKVDPDLHRAVTLGLGALHRALAIRCVN